MGIEFELKYRATADILTAVRQQIQGQEQVLQMQTTYYDTPDGQLSARRWTLRRRMENERSVCTLKTPAQGHGRQEWEIDAASVTEAIEELCKLGAPLDPEQLRQTGLIPICGARFTRVAKTITYGNSVLELALDSGVLTGGGRETPLCELEVELKTGTEADCHRFAHDLSQRYGLEPEPDSKFRRALALYRGE